MTDLAFIESGEGETIVILHGLFGSARNWGRIARDLSASFRVIALDLPNHGRSEWVEHLTYESMADAVRTFLASRGLEGRCTLLGHSMGGKVAMALALAAPSAVSRLIVADIAPVSYGHAAANEDIIAALQGLPINRLASRKDADAALASSIRDRTLRAYLLANLERQDERFVWHLNLAGLRASVAALHGFPDFPPDRRYDGRTLFVAGGRSDYIAEQGRAAIAARFPRAHIETISDAGHWVHADAPDKLVALIDVFMRGG